MTFTATPLHRYTAMTANVNVDIEDSHELLGLGHRSVMLDS